MQKTKRICSAVMMVIMMFTMTTFVGVTAPAKAVTVEENVIVVDAALTQANGTEKTVTIGDKAYDVVIGTNGFATIAAAIAAAEDGDTILLQAGNYTETPVVNKNLTFLGPKAGIDPNVRGATETADWTLSPQRGTGEAIINGIWYIGVASSANNANIVATVTDFTVDGVTLSGNGQFRHNKSSAATAAEINITVKNIVVSGSTNNMGPFFFASYLRDSSMLEHARRYITVENIHAKAITVKPLFLYIGAERFTASGVYMDAASTKPFNESIYTADGATYTTPATFTISDSMFRGTNASSTSTSRGIINMNLRNQDMLHGFNYFMDGSSSTTWCGATAAGAVQNAHIDSKSKVDVFIKNNVFVDNDNSKTDYNSSIYLGSRSTNTYMDIYENTFINNDTPTTGHSAININFGNHTCFNTNTSYYRNRVINTMLEKGATGANNILVFNGNYAEDADGNVIKPTVNETDKHTIAFYYLDWDMTKSSAPVVVNPEWETEAPPATFEFQGQTIPLTLGTNAFHAAGTAFKAAGEGNTVILCPGEYGQVYFPYSLTVLGPKAGIDPNVRGQNKTDDWTLNTNRSNANEEATITALWYVGTYTDDTMLKPNMHITIDGMRISGQGAFRNRTNANATTINTTFRNIFVDHSERNTDVFYLHGYLNGADGKTRRNIVFENIRFEGQKMARAIWADAETLYASGIYMDNTSTQCLTNTVGISNGDLYTNPVKWHFTDMNIRTHARQIINFSARTGSTNTNAAIGKKLRVDLMVTDSVFFENQDTNPYVNGTSQKNDNIIVPQQDTPNVFFTFTDNYFIGTKGMTFTTTAIASHTNAAGAYAANTVVKNNRFYNFTTDVNYATLLSTGAVDISGNYSEDQNGKVRRPIGNEAKAEWWYVDEALEHTSAEIDGVLSADVAGSVDTSAKTATFTTDKDTITFSANSAWGNTVTVYEDEQMTKPLSNPAPLYETAQTYYVKLASMDGTNYDVYTVTVNTTNPNTLDLRLS